MGLMQDRKPDKTSPNGGLDDRQIAREDVSRQLSIIDAKIAHLEESDDPNALESLNFWKAKRLELVGN